ncbi:MAG: SDR family NAD(P)-dependent oxidoreductase [Candidatus Thiodiazotropha lotti]|nr:SDR family NAD(P)-dependent oxidoreductase [Candidatus Thiodiazotropha lotti]
MLSTSRKILITGATSGIGLALLQQLHAAGHSLIAVARDAAVLSRLEAAHDRVAGYPCDLSSRHQVESLAERVQQHNSDLGLIINNAGVQYTPTFLDEDFSYDSIEYETKVNFLAPVWLTSLLLPQLISQKQTSAVVNISSGLALAPKTNSAIYCATKAAIHSFSQCLEYQLDATPVISIEAILPLVDTPMTKGRGRGKISPDDAARQIINGMSTGKREIYVGIAKWLPLLLRLSPSLVKNMFRRS